MGGVEGRTDLADDSQRTPRRQASLLLHERLQVAALDARHRDVEESVLLPCVVDRNDARVVERGRDLGLAQETLAEIGLAQPRREELERGRPLQPHVLGPVDDARPAAPQRLHEAVAAELRSDPPIDRHRGEL
jgi:hypothetical protein